MLQLMLNAHTDTDSNEIEDKHAYKNPEQWKKRGISILRLTYLINYSLERSYNLPLSFVFRAVSSLYVSICFDKFKLAS